MECAVLAREQAGRNADDTDELVGLFAYELWPAPLGTIGVVPRSVTDLSVEKRAGGQTRVTFSLRLVRDDPKGLINRLTVLLDGLCIESRQIAAMIVERAQHDLAQYGDAGPRFALRRASTRKSRT